MSVKTTLQLPCVSVSKVFKGQIAPTGFKYIIVKRSGKNGKFVAAKRVPVAVLTDEGIKEISDSIIEQMNRHV